MILGWAVVRSETVHEIQITDDVEGGSGYTVRVKMKPYIQPIVNITN
jgi:hypothetical protein